MEPKVSIVIPFYNCPFIEQAIVSALSQTYPHIEIIVVDDGSTAHTDKLAPFLSRIHYLGKANGGTASALNHGIRLASGDYVAWLSSDDMFYPDKIEQQLRFMQARQAAISFTAFDEIDAYHQITNRFIAARYPSYAEFVRAFAGVDPINGCTVMMSKALWSALGGFNEALRYTQDYDFWIRALLARVPMYFLDAPLTMYRWHGGMGTKQHWPAVEAEIRLVQDMYRPQLLEYAAQLGG